MKSSHGTGQRFTVHSLSMSQVVSQPSLHNNNQDALHQSDSCLVSGLCNFVISILVIVAIINIVINSIIANVIVINTPFYYQYQILLQFCLVFFINPLFKVRIYLCYRYNDTLRPINSS